MGCKLCRKLVKHTDSHTRQGTQQAETPSYHLATKLTSNGTLEATTKLSLCEELRHDTARPASREIRAGRTEKWRVWTRRGLLHKDGDATVLLFDSMRDENSFILYTRVENEHISK